ncbi:DUF3237 domain-containing protein [Elongatibacter sediminis]|uniref:UPF0311 protein V3330_02465 n=1 Tax=Elongatibacter sediminis TaxID=3119006 RepID=A0AAW9REG9_9GAMM
MNLEHLFTLRALVGESQTANQGPYGDRRYMPVSGGEFTGKHLSGTLLPGGADCQLVRTDHVAELDVRIMLQENDGTRFLLRGLGLRHAYPKALQRPGKNDTTEPPGIYFRQSFHFECPPGDHAWLNGILAIGTGHRDEQGVLIEVFEVP